MANTANATINGQDWTLGTFTTIDYGDKLSYAGKNGTACYAYALKFTTPAFGGKSKKITINIGLRKQSAERSSIRWALCSSDANAAKYCLTYSAVTEEHQIAKGDFGVAGLTDTVKQYTIEVETTALSANKSYYLFLWGYNNTYEGVFYVDYIKNHSVVITYDGGIVYIDNGTSFDAYEVYRDNGTGWEQYAPYIDNGSGWDPCG